MDALSTQRVEPRASPMPPLTDEDPLTPAQWKTILAIADGIIPAVQPLNTARTERELAVLDNAYSSALSRIKEFCSKDSGEDSATAYLREAASEIPGFRENIQWLITMYMPQAAKKELLMVLNFLNTRAGSFILTGYSTPISEQPVHIREDIIKKWGKARLGPLRILHSSLTLLVKQQWIRCSPMLRRVIGYPRVPGHGTPGKGYDYQFIQFPPGATPEEVETDVVIVGSGCGGAVSAKNLAEAGHKVILVDKAYHWPPEHFPMNEDEGFHHLFSNGAATRSDDASVVVITGQAWGGGGTVNWSASLQTQGFVRQAFADTGLPFFTSAEFQTCLDRVCHRMGVSADFVQQNSTNKTLLEGARKLGWSAKPVPQNTGGKQHYCGSCSLGCGSCEKQGPVVSFLPDAARAGTQFIEGFDVREVLFEERHGRKHAVGVRGYWNSRDVDGGVAGPPCTRREVVVRAKRVIISAGTMQSPLLLLRSGLTNSNIGRHLHLHPVSLLGAVHRDETRPWEGGILTSVVTEFENLDGKGHGVKLEATCMLPAFFLGWLPWTGGLEYKLLAAKMGHMTGYISIARDRGTGQVYPDPVDGRCRVKYAVSALDKRHILEGIIALAKIQYIAGAKEIFTTIPGVSHFVREGPDADVDTEGINNPRFQAWLGEIRATGFPVGSIFPVAHQMGSCRMGIRPRNSVVDPKGKVWGTDGLFVADASVFPSASGVNPMITTMALADWISRNVDLEMKGDKSASKL